MIMLPFFSSIKVFFKTGSTAAVVPAMIEVELVGATAMIYPFRKPKRWISSLNAFHF